MIVGGHPYNQVLCHELCMLDDLCKYWRHDSSSQGTTQECLFLSTDYHHDCASIASPVSGDLTACTTADHDTCDSVIPDDCDYSGTRLATLEPAPGHCSSIAECQEVARILQDNNYGVHYFVFLSETEECQLFYDMRAQCQAVGGPASAPQNCYNNLI